MRQFLPRIWGKTFPQRKTQWEGKRKPTILNIFVFIMWKSEFHNDDIFQKNIEMNMPLQYSLITLQWISKAQQIWITLGKVYF